VIEQRKQHTAGQPTTASIITGAAVTAAAALGTVVIVLNPGERVTQATGVTLGALATVMMAGQTVGQVLRSRYGREIAEQRAGGPNLIECPVEGCHGATMSQAAMDVHTRVRHGLVLPR